MGQGAYPAAMTMLVGTTYSRVIDVPVGAFCQSWSGTNFTISNPQFDRCTVTTTNITSGQTITVYLQYYLVNTTTPVGNQASYTITVGVDFAFDGSCGIAKKALTSQQ